MRIPWRGCTKPTRLLILWLPAVMLSAHGCGRDKVDELSALPAMEFRVDPSLLGPAVTDSMLRIVFRPPAVLVQESAERVARFREDSQRGQTPGDPLGVLPQLVFSHAGGGNFACTVSRLSSPPPGGVSGDWIDEYRARLVARTGDASLKDGLFRIGNVVVVQFLIQKPDLIIFRLICRGPGPEPVQIDYVVNPELYQEVLRAIESSIGSMVLF